MPPVLPIAVAGQDMKLEDLFNLKLTDVSQNNEKKGNNYDAMSGAGHQSNTSNKSNTSKYSKKSNMFVPQSPFPQTSARSGLGFNQKEFLNQ